MPPGDRDVLVCHHTEQPTRNIVASHPYNSGLFGFKDFSLERRLLPSEELFQKLGLVISSCCCDAVTAATERKKRKG